MSEHRKYDHVVRLGHPDVDGLDIGLVHIFPKLDGANASVWCDNSGSVLQVHSGSRTRVLSAAITLQGFHPWVSERLEIWGAIFAANPDWRLYGEWLVPHTLKSYREDAWREFYVFDAFDRGTGKYVPYDEYASVVSYHGIKVIEPLCTIESPSENQIRAQVETNTYLVEDGAGIGEGIVIKNFAWQNKHGRQPWAKVVRNEFKEQNRRVFGVTEKHGAFQVEAAIAEEFVTPTLVGKTRAKIVMSIADAAGVDLAAPNAVRSLEEQYRGELIPRLLQTVYTDLIVEEAWEFVKKHRDPKIDFKRLRQHSMLRVKELAQDLFA